MRGPGIVPVGDRARGIALILVAGVLGLLAVVAAAFVTMAQLERRASQQRLYATKAALLARSGIEDALARLSAGQDASLVSTRFAGEDFNADGLLSPGVETNGQVYQPMVLNVADCPIRQALRPSFFARDSFGQPDLKPVDTPLRGYSGVLGETHYVLKVEDSNARIHVNGGALDAQDRDPDGPNVGGGGANAEIAPLAANGIQDYRDPSPEGPNGFLRRLLDNLEVVVTGTNATPSLGEEVIGGRAIGGYRSLEDLKAVLGQARYGQFRGYLTTEAWVDASVVKPQPADGRPQRFLNIDEVHRLGTPTSNPRLAGVSTSSGVTGQGLPGSPWNQAITLTNQHEGTRIYPVSWERGFVYAFRQLRLAPAALEPRAPVSLNSACREVLASVFLGLRGTWLGVWDGSGGWDGAFGWFGFGGEYPYPSPGTEETPWIRTRVDYGEAYGSVSRPWYGPTRLPNPSGWAGSGESLVGSGALGRLQETPPLSRDQALAIADQILDRISQKGPFRTWEEFNAFVEALPRWEEVDQDADGDGFPDVPPVLDGIPYPVQGSGGNYERRRYEREDANSDGMMNREIFQVTSGSWAGTVAWVDRGSAALGATEVPGLTFVQKDVLKAMANPNTDLNDFNPDANLYKEVDKTDIGGTGSLPASCAHTTELTLDPMGLFKITAVARVTGRAGRLLAERGAAALLRAFGVHRDTTQADFMQDFNPGGAAIGDVFVPPAAVPYTLSGDQALLSYPEPQNLSGGAPAADAVYDGQVGLGLIGPYPGPDERIRGDLFLSLNASATGDASVPDVRGPFHAPLVRPAGADAGNLFPDGVYSEKDAALKFPMAGNFWSPPIESTTEIFVFCLSAWVKPNWFPEASPRPHALVSLSHYHSPITTWWPSIVPFDIPDGNVPMDHIPFHPTGCYYVPARNNYWQDLVGAYVHDQTSTRGRTWPSRSLLWGTTHSLYASTTLNFRGILTRNSGDWQPGATPLPFVQRPVGRLQAHRWVHLGCIGKTLFGSTGATKLILGRNLASSNGGGWTHGFGSAQQPIPLIHEEPAGMSSPNHLRFGEVAAENNMNYTADASFGNVRQGGTVLSTSVAYAPFIAGYEQALTGTSSPATFGRYLKEDGARFISPRMPDSLTRPLRVTWTEVSCDLWFDENNDGWLGDDPSVNASRNDRFGPGGVGVPDGKRDVRVDLELWDDRGPAGPVGDVNLLGPGARLTAPGASNRVPLPQGRLYYKAVFVNDWDATTRLNNPLDVTPFLDDVTVTYAPAGGCKVLCWEWDPAE